MIQMNMSTRKPRSIRRVGAQDSKDWQVPALSAVEPAVEPAPSPPRKQWLKLSMSDPLQAESAPSDSAPVSPVRGAQQGWLEKRSGNKWWSGLLVQGG
jgi:hypothetical protein